LEELTYNFMDRIPVRCSIGAEERGAPMWQAYLMRSALLMTSAALGGFGVFSVIYSFVVPSLAAQGLILLGAALAIVYFTDR
jgi:hypothetical protein